jgi:hypothetical protein
MHYLKKEQSHLLFYSGLTLLFLLFVSGCKSNDPVSPPMSVNNGTHNASLSIATRPVSSNSFMITSAKFLVKRVEFGEEENEENELAEGPFVVHIVPASTTTNIAIGRLPAGTYHRINFLIHKPSPVEVIPDPDFREGPSDDQRFSFIVYGEINGVNFVYRSHITIDEEVEFDQPIVLTQNGFVNVTMDVDPDMWFYTHDGAFLDPTDLANAHAIDMNIKASVRRAFEDNDEDGQPDGGH